VVPKPPQRLPHLDERFVEHIRFLRSLQEEFMSILGIGQFFPDLLRDRSNLFLYPKFLLGLLIRISQFLVDLLHTFDRNLLVIGCYPGGLDLPFHAIQGA